MGLLKKKTILKKAERETVMAAENEDDISFDESDYEQVNEEQVSIDDSGSPPPRRLRGFGISLDSDEATDTAVAAPPVPEQVKTSQVAIENTGEPRVRVSADVPMSVHKKLKYYSLATGKTIQTIIRDWIIQNCSA